MKPSLEQGFVPVIIADRLGQFDRIPPITHIHRVPSCNMLAIVIIGAI